MAHDDSDLGNALQSAQSCLDAKGQSHVLRFWPELDDAGRRRLLADAASIPWDVVEPLIDSHVRRKPPSAVASDLAPPEVFPANPDANRAAEYAAARRLGRDVLAAGKVAAFTVAGGQGTRLGFDGPKGMVQVTPVGDRTLFQLFAETVRAASDKYGVSIPWYIMTSQANHAATVEYFEANACFGLPSGDVRFFSQRMLPVFDFEGRILLESKDRIALAPDGHGGSLHAMVAGGALADMQARGIETISYFQVDNPLVKPFDPLFIGLHVEQHSDMSSKVARKADDLERVGNVCVRDDRVCVVEYSEFPDGLAHARNADGSRRFDCGNLAIHLLSVDFVDRVIARSCRLPFRRAEKKVAHIDDAGHRVEPAKPNAVKLETFVFDALPFADHALVLEVDRAEEFSPVKNATGVDSLESAKRDQCLRACRWLERAGVAIPHNADGSPSVTVALSPRFALDTEDVDPARMSMPLCEPGAAVYVE